MRPYHTCYLLYERPGISPFEMLFGRKVRGPLKLVKDKLLNSPSHRLVTVTHYMENLKSTLLRIRTFASNNLRNAQVMKSSFDKNTAVRSFKEGNQVLAFIPTPGSLLQAKYQGPYEIVKKISDVDYVLKPLIVVSLHNQYISI